MPQSGGPYSIVSKDLNGDQIPDIATLGIYDATLHIRTGNANGQFTETQAINVLGSQNFPFLGGVDLTSSDVDDDGDIDFATANGAAGTATILINNGLGNFSISQTIESGMLPEGVAFLDANRDGWLDLAAVDVQNGQSKVVIHYGFTDQQGAFKVGATTSTIPIFTRNSSIGNSPIDIAVADFNNDGYQDLVTADYGTDSATVLTNNGTGGWFLSTWSVGNDPVSVLVADFDSDGLTDYAVASEVDSHIVVMTNQGNGQFSQRSSLVTPSRAVGMDAGDLNRDNIIDLVVADRTSPGAPGRVCVFLGIGNGTFASRMDFVAGSGTNAVALSDLDLNGLIDITSANIFGSVASANPTAGSVKVITFQALPPIAIPGGPYTVGAGSSISFHGSAQSGVGSVVAYEWDLDYDGISFDVDATGSTATFEPGATAVAQIRNIALRVRDSIGQEGISATSLTILGTVSKWSFSEGTGTIAADTVSDNDGQLINGPTWTVGSAGAGLKFDGVNDYVAIPDHPSLDFSNSLTMVAWVKMDAIDNQYETFIWKDDPGAPDFRAYSLARVRDDGSGGAIFGKFYSTIVTTSGRTEIFSSRIPVAGQWYQVVSTYDGVQHKLYVNGVLEATQLSSGAIRTTNGQLQFGRTTLASSPNYLRGNLDEVALYNRALSASEIQSTYLLPPNAVIQGPATIAEGAIVAYSGGSSSVIGNALYEWDFDYQPNSFTVDAVGVVGNFDASHLDDPASRTIALRVTDTNGLSDIETLVVSILNVAPRVRIANLPSSVAEGTPVTLNAIVTDPGFLDTHSYSWSVTKNGTPFSVTGNQGPTFTFVPDDEGQYGVSLTVTDDDGGVDSSINSQITYDFENLSVGGLVGQDAWYKLGNESWNKNGYVYSGEDNSGPGAGKYLGPEPGRNGVLQRLNNSEWSYTIPANVANFAFEFDAKNLHGGGHYIQENGVWWETYLLQLGIGPVYVGFEGGNTNRLAIWTNTGAWYASSPIANPANSWHIKAQIYMNPDNSGTISLLAEDKGGNQGLLPVTGLTNVPMNTVTRESFNNLLVRLQSGEFSPLIDNLRITVGNTISVFNVTPTIALSGDTHINEGSVFTLNLGAITDPGADTVNEYTVQWGDGTSNSYSHGGPVTHTYANGLINPGVTQPVRLTSSVSADSFITDAAELGGPNSTHGQETGLWSINYFTPGAGGSLATRPVFKFDLSRLPNFTAAGDATFRVYLSGPNNPNYYHSTARRVDLYQVTSAWAEANVSWNNQPSTSYLNSTEIVYVGDNRWVEWRVPQALLQQWLDNPSSNHGLMLVNELPDSFVYDLVFASRELSGNTAAQLLFDVTGPTTIRVDVRDEDGLHTNAGTFDLTVDNVVPIADPGGPYVSNEGATITFSGSASYDPGNDIERFEWDLDYQAGDFTVEAIGDSHTIATPDGPFEKTIALRVIDADGAVSAIVATTLAVTNLPPVLSVTSPATPVLENSQASASGNYADPGIDVVSLSANVGDIVVSSDRTWAWSFDVGDAVALPAFVRITATDEDGDSTSVTFPLTVVPVNDAPHFIKGPDILRDEDAGLIVSEGWASQISSGPANESDQVLAFEVVSVSAPILFSELPTVNASGDLRFATAPNAYGTSSITVRLRDNGGTSNGGVDTSELQTFFITISPVNDAPVAFDDAASSLEDQAIAIAVLENDIDVDNSSLVPSIVMQPNHGMVEVLANGVIQWTPEANWYGETEFTYLASDGLVQSNLATVTLSISAANDAPTIPDGGTGGPYSIAEGQPLILNGSGFDIDGEPLVYAWDINGDGNFNDAFGASATLAWSQLAAIGIDGRLAAYTLSFQVSDGVETTTASTSLSVQNLSPTVELTVSRSQAVTMQGLEFVVTASDPNPSDTLSYSLDFGDGSPLVTMANATHVYTSTGTFHVTVTVTDDEGAVQQESATIQIGRALKEGGVLWLGGSNGDDLWTITALPTASVDPVYSYAIRLNTSTTTNFTGLTSVVPIGGGGTDSLILNGNDLLNTFEIRADRIDFQSVQFTTTDVESRTVNARGTGDTVIHYGGPAVINGGAGSDTLTAASGTQHQWIVNGPNSGVLDGQLSFSSMELLMGDVQDDEFKFLTGGYISVSVDGNAGSNRIDFTDSSNAISVNLQTSRVSAAGVVSNVGRFIGSRGIAFDTILAPNAANSWIVDGPGSGLLNGVIRFENFENLTGNSQIDYFRVIANGTLSGTLNGGSGTDVIDFSTTVGPVTVDLSNNSSNKIATLLSITQWIGSAESDIVIGANNNNIWTVLASNEVAVDGISLRDFETLVGGTAGDTFRAKELVSFAGAIDGGLGIDKLDYATFSSAVVANLTIGSATGFVGLSNIENVSGGSGDDFLIGNASDNVILGGSGDDILIGMAGADSLNGNNGRDLIIGGNGSDTLHGNNGDDIIIGGVTTYANESSGVVHNSALVAILSEWRRIDVVYSLRVARIKGLQTDGLNAGYVLDGSTVLDDLSVDVLWGDANIDWFWASSNDSINSSNGEVVSG